MRAEGPYYILEDANYNVVGLTDSTGALEQQYSYRPYGERLANEGGNGDLYHANRQAKGPRPKRKRGSPFYDR